MDVDIEGFQNTSSIVFSNSQSNVFPSFPNNPNSISNKLSSISLDGKRKRQDIDVNVNKSARMDTELAVNAEEKKMRNSGDKFTSAKTIYGLRDLCGFCGLFGFR